MTQRIKELLRATPYVAFKIKADDGREYIIPTADHAKVAPSNSRVLIFGDDDSLVTLSGLHIVAVEEQVRAGN